MPRVDPGLSLRRGHSLLVRSLPVLTALLLFCSWWLSLIVLLDTPIVKVTPPKLVIFVGWIALVALGAWRFASRADRPIIILTATYVIWLLASATLRGSGADLKLAVGYTAVFGGAWLLAYVSARVLPRRSANTLMLAIMVGLAITAAGAILERTTFPPPGHVDSLESLWRFVRPPIEYPDAASGITTAPVHFSSGDPSVPRVASWFAHANYLAFFGMLAVAAAGTLVVMTLRKGTYGQAFLAGIAILASAVCVVWTYSRAGLVGILLVAIGVGGVSAWARVTWSGRFGRISSAVPILVVIISIAGMLTLDQTVLRRFEPLVPGNSGPSIAGPSPGTVEEAAARSGDVRIRMQLAAIGLVAANPRDVLIGPGQAAFDLAVHDASHDWFVRGATGIADPNSAWLALAVSGGSIGVALFATLLIASWSRVVRAARHVQRTQWAGPVLLMVAAWLPAWAITQMVGTNPFNSAEAAILGTLLGAATAHSGDVGRSDLRASVNGGDDH